MALNEENKEIRKYLLSNDYVYSNGQFYKHEKELIHNVYCGETIDLNGLFSITLYTYQTYKGDENDFGGVIIIRDSPEKVLGHLMSIDRSKKINRLLKNE